MDITVGDTVTFLGALSKPAWHGPFLEVADGINGIHHQTWRVINGHFRAVFD